MHDLFRGIFAAITQISYHLRMPLIILMAAALAVSIAAQIPFRWLFISLPWFSLVTVGVFLFISVPLKWRRLTISRPYFHRKGMGAVVFPIAAMMVVITTVFESGFVLFATLFTFPFEHGPEFNWTLYLLAATGAISFLIMWAADRRCWKSARWSYFRFPILMGFLFAALVHVVSTGSQIRECGKDPKSGVCAAITQPQGAAVNEKQSDGPNWLFKAPSDADAISVLERLFGKSIFDSAQRKRDEAQQQVDRIVTDLKNKQEELCPKLTSFGTQPDKNKVNLIKEAKDACQDAKKLLPQGKDRKLSWFAWLKDERMALGRGCNALEQLGDIDDFVLTVSDSSKRLRTVLQCDQLSAEEPKGDQALIRPEQASVGDQTQEASPASPVDESSANAGLSPDAVTEKQRKLKLLEAYSILDGYLQAKIVDGVGFLYVYRSWKEDANSSNLDLTSIAGYFCEQSKPADKAGERFDEWCNSKSVLRAAASIGFSPYVLQGFVLSIYLTALLMAFRRRDDGDPDLGKREEAAIDAKPGRKGSARKLTAAALRARPAGSDSRRFGLPDWLELDQMPSIIDPSIGEIDITEPEPLAGPFNAEEFGTFEAQFDRPIDLGEHRISFSPQNARSLSNEQEKLFALITRWAEAFNEVGGQTEELCKVMGAPLKILLAKCPDEISIQHQLPSVLRDDLAAEFRAYESVYFSSRGRNPAAIAEALTPYKRLQLRTGDGIERTVDLRAIKQLDDKVLCGLVALASARALTAVFK